MQIVLYYSEIYPVCITRILMTSSATECAVIVIVSYRVLIIAHNVCVYICITYRQLSALPITSTTTDDSTQVETVHREHVSCAIVHQTWV